MTAARIVQKASRKRRTPILHYLDQFALFDQRHQSMLHRHADTDSAKHSLNHQFRVIERDWSLRVECHSLLSLLKLPAIHPFAEAEADARVILQIRWRLRRLMQGEVVR